MTYLFLNLKKIFLGYTVYLQVVFKLQYISKKFSNIVIEKNPLLSGPMQFKYVLFKGQLY